MENIEKQNVLLVYDKVTNTATISGFGYTFNDILKSDGILRRTFSDGTVFYYRDNVVAIKNKALKTEYMQRLSVPKSVKPFDAATLDIETVFNNGKHVPYLYSFFDGVEKHYFFERSPDQLFNTMLKRKYRGR